MNILTAYENSLKMGNKSANTISGYLKDVKKLVDFFEISTMEEVNKLTKLEIEAFYGSQSSLKPVSLKGLVRNLMAFFHWVDETEEHPFFSVKFGGSRYPKVVREEKDVLDADECVRIIAAGANVQERFMIALMIFTALRRGAIRNIKVSDVNDCVIRNIIEKGDKRRVTFMDDVLCTMYNVFMAQRDSDSEYLFYNERGESSEDGRISGTTVNSRVKAAAARAGITKDITAHRIRATRITQLIQTKGIQAAQLVAGHANIMTTKLYDGSDETFVRNILLNN
jgi:integrase/recombinase XerD